MLLLMPVFGLLTFGQWEVVSISIHHSTLFKPSLDRSIALFKLFLLLPLQTDGDLVPLVSAYQSS